MAEPMYRQIADDLRRRIEAGELRPGERLGTEIELRDTYGASRNTIRDAIKLLMTRGLVETRPGQGTFVAEEINPLVTTLTADPEAGRGGGEEGVYIAEVTASGRTPATSPPRVEVQRAHAAVAFALGIAEGDQLLSRHSQRFIDGIPWSLQTSFFPMSLVERGAWRLIQADDIRQGTAAYLRETLDIKQAGYRDRIAVRAPDGPEAGFFRLPDDGRIPVIEIRRTAFDERGTPIWLTVSVYPADRNQFAVNVGEVPGTG
jgi:GntR family transcriptional regulator